MSELTKLLLIAVFIISVYLMSRPFTSAECRHNQNIMKESFQGIVVDKEEDSFHSGSERVTVGKEKYVFAWSNELHMKIGEPFYDKITVGDSIVKKEGELILQIFKADSDSIITVDLSFPCDNDD